MTDKDSPDEPLATRTEAEGATVDLPEGTGFFALGQVLGERYEILEMLGRGGMGEVWSAFDLKLRVEVGLKALREELFQSERRLELLRQEVRAAREVVSPNVCRIFDLIEIDGRELVSMEYVDGATLLGVLQERGPLELKEAQDIASQFLSGLEAIHKAGLVHRDVKPENIMLTRAGRVVVMDFGLARGPESGAGSVSGTPAYMAPEHAAGQEVDARADVYSAGVVLAEMVSPDGIKNNESRQSLWEGVRSKPAQVPDSPWAPVIKRAVARDRERRQNSAHTLIRELEDVTLRVEGAEDLHPYPGLASFTEDDAEYFFGREAEVETMWAKLDGPARLLGLVGPSGAGKSSFLRAGVIPHASADWSIVRCTPGASGMASIRQALVPALEGDTEALGALAGGGDDATLSAWARWQKLHGRALLIVDQFEELFTLNATDVQQRVAVLLRRLPLEADVHVVVSMRDDFLMECNRFEELRPVVTDLTLLDRPTGANLRRALVQPATKCGYRFEDDELVGEMLAEVEGERGALPLLAFAAARLWEKRDRETGLLTRQAYHEIGGVGGALARHAEATVERIGVERIPIVRELFRNLVTAEGTRAVREWDEMLSVFEDGGREGLIPSRVSATEVLTELINARLLTSYEVREDEHEPIRRVEIVHESLLDNWPRLVRWQTQDADAVQVREQLRQAAKTWDDQGQSDDTLWTGSAYRQYSVWREGYPGGLTEVEEAFANAMVSLATRRKRRRRIAVTVGVSALIAILAVVTGLWWRSVLHERRAEAQKLVALGQLLIEGEPSESLAHAITSLELADSREARYLALEALWRGPTELRFESDSGYSHDFSPDGRWLATAGSGAKLWPSDGGPPVELESSTTAMEIVVSPRGDLVAHTMGTKRQAIGLWSFPEGRFLRSFDLGEGGTTMLPRFTDDGEQLLTSTFPMSEPFELVQRSWAVDGGEPEVLSRIPVPFESTTVIPGLNPANELFAWADGRAVHVAPLSGLSKRPVPRWTLHHDQIVAGVSIEKTGRVLATTETDGTIRVWSLTNEGPIVTHTLHGKGGTSASAHQFNPSGTMLATVGGWLWDLEAPPGTDPIRIRGGYAGDFHPSGEWAATDRLGEVSLWPLNHAYPHVFRGHKESIRHIAFTPDGNHLVSTSVDLTVRLWPLEPGTGETPRVLYRAEGTFAFPRRLSVAPDSTFVVFGNPQGEVIVQPLDGGPPTTLEGFTDVISWTTVGPQGRRVAASSGGFLPEEALVRIWDLESGETTIVDAGDGRPVINFLWLPDDTLWVYSLPVLRVWDLKGAEPAVTEEYDLSGPEYVSELTMDFDPNGRRALVFEQHETENRLSVQHLVTHEFMELEDHRGISGTFVWDPDREIVISNDRLGAVRVGPLSGGNTHLLLGHDGRLTWATFSPDGLWIATAGNDKTIRLWPMPDLTKPPLHTLPREELIAKLKTLTNLRVVRDPESSTGWTLTHDPFPGWETVPTW